MIESEKQFVKYINIARQQPTFFVSLIDKQLDSFINDRELPLTNEIIYETNEGRKAWSEARSFLLDQRPIHPLMIHEGLASAAEDHQEDLCSNAVFGHQGTDGSTFSDRILRHCKKGPGAMAEIIGADFDLEERNTAEMTILSLIIDDGVKDRGHRKTIFNPTYNYIGCAYGRKDEKIITVCTLTEKNMELLPSKSLQKDQNNSSFRSFNKWEDENKRRLSDITNKNVSVKDHQPKFGFSTGPIPSSKSKKMVEKREKTRTFYEDGAKVIETISKIMFSDGSVEENMEKRTIYTD